MSSHHQHHDHTFHEKVDKKGPYSHGPFHDSNEGDHHHKHTSHYGGLHHSSYVHPPGLLSEGFRKHYTPHPSHHHHIGHH